MPFKFKWEKASSLLGHTEIRYIPVYTDENGDFETNQKTNFQIIASPQGIELKGGPLVIQDKKDLEVFAAVMGDAWNGHRDLVPKFVGTSH